MPSSVCSVPLCERPAKGRGLCQAHYFRLRRTGSVGDARIAAKGQRTPCITDGCGQPRASRLGYCWPCARRYGKGGSPDYRGSVPWGDANTEWKGDDVGYTAAHDRVRRRRGRAVEHACAHCGGQAAHWAYDHADVDERVTRTGHPYSPDPDHYLPLCVSCHKRMDLAVA